MAEPTTGIAPVTRTKAEARASYDRMAPGYDRFAGRFERRYNDAGLRLLDLRPGELVLELGYGTGASLEQIARMIGPDGHAAGVDISEGMRDVAEARLETAGLADRVDLYVGDAAGLPFDDGIFDAVFTAFTLELFDTPEIPEVLGEVGRVLRPGGRLGVVAMATSERPGPLMRAYVFAHRHMQRWVDCRPIPADRILRDAGFGLRRAERMSMWGLPVWLLVGESPAPAPAP